MCSSHTDCKQKAAQKITGAPGKAKGQVLHVSFVQYFKLTWEAFHLDAK